MTAAEFLARALAEPDSIDGLADSDWEALLAAARAERLIGSLGYRLQDRAVPGKAAQILEDARRFADQERVQALWEAEMAWRALAPIGVPVILLKGTAFLAAKLSAGVGRSVGDLDILVPQGRLDEVQQALLDAGWEWVKEDAYDDLYYRRWMHELPPLIHKERDRMIDVHHTILPPTARITPDADALIADSVALEYGLRTLSPEDMIVHAALHLFADGDLAGGMRNLWDIDRLLREFSEREDFWTRLEQRAALHGAGKPVARAARHAHGLYDTPVPEPWRQTASADPLFRRRLLARDGWGRATRPATRFAFYIRSHWMRMPPLMLARHLLVKARR